MTLDVLEATANTVIGLLLGLALLAAYGLPIAHSLALQAGFVALSWGRSFVLRRLFREIGRP